MVAVGLPLFIMFVTNILNPSPKFDIKSCDYFKGILYHGLSSMTSFKAFLYACLKLKYINFTKYISLEIIITAPALILHFLTLGIYLPQNFKIMTEIILRFSALLLCTRTTLDNLKKPSIFAIEQ